MLHQFLIIFPMESMGHRPWRALNLQRQAGRGARGACGAVNPITGEATDGAAGAAAAVASRKHPPGDGKRTGDWDVGNMIDI